MANGTAGIADRAIAEPGSTGVPDPSREHGNVERIPEVTPHRVQPHGGTSGEQLPDRTDHEGEVLSPEYRVRIECDCSLGACLCPRRPSNRKA